MKEHFTFFWSGPFSNWYRSAFTHNGVRYNCGEQYMMHQKALLFGDKHAAIEIMKEKDPRKQKAWGRKVKNFSKKVWDNKCKPIMVDGLTSKFRQNAHCLSSLLATVGTELVEASPNDDIWGIGLSEDDPRAWDKSTWKGTNWLGEVLTQVRNNILEKYA